jgi:IclR family acetate operon transcriptional repressor
VSAFRVLESVAELQPAGLSELTRAVDLPKSTVQRCLLTLHELGWLRPTTTQPTRWHLTYRAFSVGVRARDHQQIREVALPFLNELQLQTTETIHLCAPDGDELVLIERLDTAHPLRAFLPLGQRIPLHASATGLAFLAASPDEFVDGHLAGDLPPRTPRTITDPDTLRRTLDEIRTRGYSINDQGLSTGITAIGAAILDAHGQPVGSISVSGPTSRITAEKFETYGKAVHETARKIHATL